MFTLNFSTFFHLQGGGGQAQGSLNRPLPVSPLAKPRSGSFCPSEALSILYGSDGYFFSYRPAVVPGVAIVQTCFTLHAHFLQSK